MLTETYVSDEKPRERLTQKRELETGFPSPAADHMEDRLNLHDHLVKRPVATFFARVSGDDETGLGLCSGDLLVIDRSLAPRHDSLVVADVDSELCACRLLKTRSGWMLERGNGSTRPVTFEDAADSPIWGRVTHVIHPV